VDLVLHRGRAGEVYNIGGECEMENIEVARRILKLLGRRESLLHSVTGRPGHDRRYAMNCDKIKSELGWRQECSFDCGLADTIRWYQEHSAWLDDVRSGAYREYFIRHYQHRDSTLARLKSVGVD
jgi:dTDP-glucose 4,6-dehydratase